MKWLCLLLLPLASAAQTTDSLKHTINYLALGDSYTVGQGVPSQRTFPQQTVDLLRKAGYTVASPTIIAKTGWTTTHLQDSLKNFQCATSFNLVTLLIGVNNQFRGKSLSQYKVELDQLVKKTIELAGGHPEHVIILSIPDYACTPFASRMNTKLITAQLTQFNQLNKMIAAQYKTHYLEITESSRLAKTDATLTTWDGLHPSEKQYAGWAKQLAALVTSAAW